MTLVVAIARGNDYALMTCDSGCYVGTDTTDESRWERVDVDEPHKVVQVTPYVLAATVGDHAIGWHFKRALVERVSQADDLDRCCNAARAVVESLGVVDTRMSGSLYVSGTKAFRRVSLDDEHAFSFVITGFRRDGTTGMLYGAGSSVVDVPETDGVRIAITRPYGVELEDVDPHFYVEDPSLAGAFGQAFATHHVLGEKYDSRISRDVNCTMLNRSPVRGGAPVLLPVAVDRTDVEAARQIYETLTTRPPLAA
jgi:hypothetical protein